MHFLQSFYNRGKTFLPYKRNEKGQGGRRGGKRKNIVHLISIGRQHSILLLGLGKKALVRARVTKALGVNASVCSRLIRRGSDRVKKPSQKEIVKSMRCRVAYEGGLFSAIFFKRIFVLTRGGFC